MHGGLRRFLGKPMFMEVPPDVALTDLVLDIIQSTAGEMSDGLAEQVSTMARRPRVVDASSMTDHDCA